MFFSSISVHLKIPFTFTIIISVIVTIQSLSTIISNYYFIGIFPYHILNIIPALFIDQTVLKHNKNKINKKRITKIGSLLLYNNRYFIASNIISLFYIPLFFPWTADVFGGFLNHQMKQEQTSFFFKYYFL